MVCWEGASLAFANGNYEPCVYPILERGVDNVTEYIGMNGLTRRRAKGQLAQQKRCSWR